MGNSMKAFCAHHLEEEDMATEVALPRAQDYTASVKVDAPLLRFIVGKGGKTKVKIEKDTATQLIVPSPHQARNGSSLVVKGPSQEKVDEAIGHIQYVLQEATETEDSHFISLPLAIHPALIKKVGMFRDSVMALATALDNNDTDHGIEESIFINPATLHLTVLMLKLWNKERIAAAVDVLQSMKSRLMEALENRPVAVRLRGLECMTGSPAKAHVLYARAKDADQQNRLLNTCKVIRDAFMEAGLVSDKDKKRELKLHATLINTQRRRGKRLPFDARSILAKYKDHDWGKHTIMEVHLSQRFVFDENGYYHCCSSIQLPSA